MKSAHLKATLELIKNSDPEHAIRAFVECMKSAVDTALTDPTLSTLLSPDLKTQKKANAGLIMLAELSYDLEQMRDEIVKNIAEHQKSAMAANNDVNDVSVKPKK